MRDTFPSNSERFLTSPLSKSRALKSYAPDMVVALERRRAECRIERLPCSSAPVASKPAKSIFVQRRAREDADEWKTTENQGFVWASLKLREIRVVLGCSVQLTPRVGRTCNGNLGRRDYHQSIQLVEISRKQSEKLKLVILLIFVVF